ncbi:MAG: DUF4912 domain-containing protein [Firmicutes bacterium]|nr:DUF4912 domain-containing protein [Bacillota bacterium]
MAADPQAPPGHEEILPEYYEEDRLVLLPRNPYSLYAYWEISPSTRNRIVESWGEANWCRSSPVLRICKHHPSHRKTIESHLDIDLDPDANNWYITVESADRFYHAELGRRRPGGTFFSLLSSNLVCTPRDSISHQVDENWQLPDWKSRKLIRRIAVYHLSSPELIRRLPGQK